MSDRARPGETDEALTQFEQNLARRLQRMAEQPPPPELQEHGLDFIRSQNDGSQPEGPRRHGGARDATPTRKRR